MTNENLIRAKQANREEFFGLVRCGFELETQRVGSMDWTSMHRQTKQVTRQRVVTATPASEWLQRITLEDYQKRQARYKYVKMLRKMVDANPGLREIQVPLNGEWVKVQSLLSYSGRGHSGFSTLAGEIGFVTLCKCILAVTADTAIRKKLKRIVEKLAAIEMGVGDNTVTFSPDTRTEEYQENVRMAFEEVLSDRLAVQPSVRALDWKQDGSVQGPEITTRGGCTSDYVNQVLVDLFGDLNRVGFEVTTGCSFHVHMSIYGVTPRYSAQFQSRLIIALLNDSRVPASVRERWQSPSLQRFFSFQLDDTKYRFVAFRGSTWEFRCFGNISNSDDAKMCIRIASDAYHSALNDTSNVSIPIGVSFDQVCLNAVQQNITFNQALERLSTQSDAA